VAVPMLHVDVLDQTESFQQVHRAVDARQPDPEIYLPGASVDLGYLKVLRGSGQDLQDRHPGPGQLQSLLVQGLFQFGGVHEGRTY
jgi:hypothetical protein